MIWSNYSKYFYPGIAKYFGGIIDAKTWHHAYLFIGDKELGPLRMAKEIALGVITLGLEEKYREKIEQQFEKGMYPDFYLLERLYDEKNKKLNQNISIDQVRELKDKIQHKSFLNLAKIIVIKEVDRLNQDSANALLKVLEEPPPNTIFFLLTDNLSSLLETIVSRCQQIRFYQQSLDKIRDYLQVEFALPEKNAKNLAHLSAGLPERAILYATDQLYYQEYLDLLTKVLSLFELLLYERFKLLRELLPKELKDYNSQKARAEELLNLLEIIFRDMLLIKQSLGNLVYLEFRAKDLEKFSTRYEQAQIVKFLEEIQASRVALRQNLNIFLVLENLLINL